MSLTGHFERSQKGKCKVKTSKTEVLNKVSKNI